MKPVYTILTCFFVSLNVWPQFPLCDEQTINNVGNIIVNISLFLKTVYSSHEILLVDF